MRLLPDPRHGRVLAVVLVLIVLLLVYLLGIHWWFVAPQRQYRSQIAELRAEEARFRAMAQQRDAIRDALAQVRQFDVENPGFLPQASFDLAVSALIQRLQEQIDGLQAGDACTLVSRTPSRVTARRGEEAPEFEKVTVKVRMRCEMEYFGTLLHGLESSSPQLFVSELTIVGRRGTAPVRGQPQQAGSLDVNFDMYGYLPRARNP